MPAAGDRNAHIAERLQVTGNTVRKWRRRFRQQGLVGLRDQPRSGRPRRFPAAVVAEAKAIACELPATRGTPTSRWSLADLREELLVTGLVEEISTTTLWRWLAQDAIRPWQHRSWVFPRAPDFAIKAGVALDLYQRRFQGRQLERGEFVISADEKTSIQARCRCHPSLPLEGRRQTTAYRDAPSTTRRQTPIRSPREPGPLSRGLLGRPPMVQGEHEIVHPSGVLP